VTNPIRLIAGFIIACALTACAQAPLRVPVEEARQQVMATERAFAKTMADRDHAAFARFISEDAIFLSGKTLRGRQEVVDAWARFYVKPDAPFSWEPDAVEVLASGNLAHSTGPVRDPQGKVFARFSSIWRLEAPGQWRIVFDQGETVCECAKTP